MALAIISLYVHEGSRPGGCIVVYFGTNVPTITAPPAAEPSGKGPFRPAVSDVARGDICNEKTSLQLFPGETEKQRRSNFENL